MVRIPISGTGSSKRLGNVARRHADSHCAPSSAGCASLQEQMRELYSAYAAALQQQKGSIGHIVGRAMHSFQNEEFVKTPPNLTGSASSFIGANGKRSAEALSVKINVHAETPQLGGVDALISSMDDKRTEGAISAINQDASFIIA